MKFLELTTGLLLPFDVESVGFARYFWQLLSQHYPELMPTAYGNSEPLEHQLADADIEEMLNRAWKRYIFIWRARDRRFQGWWSMTNGRRHSKLTISGKPHGFSCERVNCLYSAIAADKQVDLGHTHVLAEPEWERNKRWYRQMLSPFNIGINTVDITRCLPNLPWATFFGKPYAELIGLETLLSAPAHHTERWGDGVYIQVTADIEDTFRQYEEFDQLREEIKKHLGRELFFDPASTVSQYRAPVFQIEMEAHP